MEDKKYLEEQIITYIGNKRKILPLIESVVREILKSEGKDRLVCADVFSGSGVVARMLKQHSARLIVNDLEDYSRVINECYLTNREDFNRHRYDEYLQIIAAETEVLKPGIIAETYAPKDEENIRPGERCFFTPRNAMYIDTVRQAIEKVPEEYQRFYLAPLLYEVSVHTNTSGVFKGFYKDAATGIGKFGGTAGDCLGRIKEEMKIKCPVLSRYSADTEILQMDANELARQLHRVDVAYLDPPYNQHPYGSNYFMLNTVLNYRIGSKISRVSGIPEDWNRSVYNKRAEALKSLDDLVGHLDAKYVIISYSSEGFVSKDEMTEMLGKYGKVDVQEVQYNAFRGSRNLAKRNVYVDEYLFVVNYSDL